MVLVMLNLLAFLFHTTLDLCDEQYRRVRAELAARQTFFHDVQALTRYLYFASWQALINFMFTQLELDTDAPSPPRKRAKRRGCLLPHAPSCPALLARGLCAPLPPCAPGSHPRPPCADVPLSAHCRTEGVLPALMPPISLPQI